MGDPFQESPTPWRDESLMRRLYVEEGLLINEIAENLETTRKTISKWLDKHDINYAGRSGYKEEPWRDRGYLRKEYIIRGKSAEDIASHFGCSAVTIHNWLNKYKIERCKPWRDEETLREYYIRRGLTVSEVGDKFGVDDTVICDWLEDNEIPARTQTPDGLKNEELLRGLYFNENLSLSEIASELDTSYSAVFRWMNRHGIERRDKRFQPGESHRYHDIPSDEHPGYNGGSARYGKGWNKKKKRKVRKRDGRKCRDCSLSQEEHLEVRGQKLHIHHIVPARSFDDPLERNSEDNLVTLCIDCHGDWERIAPLQPRVV